MAKLIFLGTAGSTAVARKNLRSSAGIILQMEDLQFHIDPGPGILQRAHECGVNLNHTTAIFISHNHINHCNDLNLAIEAMTHGGIEQRGVVLGSKSVLQGSETSSPAVTKHHLMLAEKVIPVEHEHKVGIELVEINTLPADHTDKTAIGFKFFSPKFTLSYTGDTAITDSLLEQLTGSDILVLNVPYPGSMGQGKNLDSQAAIKIISHVRPKLAVITHFGLEMLKADPLQESREIQRITGVQTIAAKDGLSIIPDGYGQLKSTVKGY